MSNLSIWSSWPLMGLNIKWYSEFGSYDSTVEVCAMNSIVGSGSWVLSLGAKLFELGFIEYPQIVGVPVSENPILTLETDLSCWKLYKSSFSLTPVKSADEPKGSKYPIGWIKSPLFSYHVPT